MWMKEPPFYRSHENHRTFPHFSSKQKNNWIKAGSGKVLYSMAPLILSWVGRDPKVCRGDRIWARSRLVLSLRAPRAPIGSLRPLIFSDQSPAAYCEPSKEVKLKLRDFHWQSLHLSKAYFFPNFFRIKVNRGPKKTMAGTARKSTGSKRKSTKVVRQALKRKIVKVDPQVRLKKFFVAQKLIFN